MSEPKYETMTVCYICGPYRAATINRIHENIERARRCAVKYWQQGYAVICPHLNSALMDGVVPDEQFLAGAKKLLTLSWIVVMMPFWEASEGARAEHDLAMKLGKTIIYEG